jgi:hypothetical protein
VVTETTTPPAPKPTPTPIHITRETLMIGDGTFVVPPDDLGNLPIRFVSPATGSISYDRRNGVVSGCYVGPDVHFFRSGDVKLYGQHFLYGDQRPFDGTTDHHLIAGKVVLTLHPGEFEIGRLCGTLERMSDLEFTDTIKEDGTYLVNSIHNGLHIAPAKIVGQIATGTYVSSGGDEYSLCMVHAIRTTKTDHLHAMEWIPLGYGQITLDIDDDWAGIGSSGCGEWHLDSVDVKPTTTNEGEDPAKESVWEYCARVGAKELQGDYYPTRTTTSRPDPQFKVAADLPEHVAVALERLTFHPAPVTRMGESTYSARCGYVDGNSEATLLMCQPANFSIFDRYSPPSNGAFPLRDNCLFNELEPGDTSATLFTPEVMDLMCESSRDEGSIRYGYGCAEAYANGPRVDYMDRFVLRRLFPNNVFRNSYVMGEYFYPVLENVIKFGPDGDVIELGDRIDRDGYFSFLWKHIPEGCTGYEMIERSEEYPNLGHDNFSLNDGCNPEESEWAEVASVISAGRVKLPEWVLQGEERD